MHSKKNLVFVLLLLLIAGSSQLLTGGQNPETTQPFHTEAEKRFFESLSLNPIGPGEYFLTSVHCQGCHGFDSAGVANIDGLGNSVNLFDRWQTTMMANSARDPLWRAKVSHEILVNPAIADDIQDKCTSCHAPMGHYNAILHGAAHYGLADLAADSLGQDGVSCAGCHTIGPSSPLTFSGHIPYDTTRTIYGPFVLPLTGPMQLYEGYTPTYSAHMGEAAICASCHTLFTDAVDSNGTATGVQFPEQATYHEYLNSRYPGDSITCQSCHMPQLADPVVIANGLLSLPQRYPFNQHEFVGANSFMVTMIKNNKVALGSTAEDWKFDSTIAATNRLLRDSSIVLQLALDSLSTDTGFFRVRIQNKAGHKFPSGYPSRRAVLQVVVTDALGDTVFKSGTFQPDYRVTGETAGFEMHHDIISQPDIPQIYEMAMGDVYGRFTSVLMRAALLLKDNRIPPAGFTTTAAMYDTTKISADALADPDFNKVNAVEGSGTDIVHYHVPLTGLTGSLRVHASVYYQSVPPKWLDEMFGHMSAEIDSFQTMYDQADKSPLLIASDSLVNLALAALALSPVENAVRVFPSLSAGEPVNIQSYGKASIRGITLYTADGKMVSKMNFKTPVASYAVMLPAPHTVYLLKIQTGEKFIYKKVIRQ